jgi:uncharacterized protein YjbI with pentapeptide repeats
MQIKAEEAKLFEKQRGNPEHFEKLKKTGECVACDLRGFDITEALKQYRSLYGYAYCISIRLQNADLTGANLADADLKYGRLEGANLKDANLTNANLGWVNLQYANLEGTNLKSAYLKRANLNGANLSGSNLKYAILVWATLDNANFTGANLNYANLANIKGIEKAIFVNTDFTGTNFKECSALYDRLLNELSKDDILKILAKAGAKNIDKAIFK